MKASIPGWLLQKVFRHAEREYPRECCGLMFGSVDGTVRRLKSCKNVQDNFSRDNLRCVQATAGQAYQIDPKDLLEAQKEIRRTGEKLCVIYHSHNDEPAEFSTEDARFALDGGKPLYPETAYLIMAVAKGRVRDAKIYTWDSSRKEFLS